MHLSVSQPLIYSVSESLSYVITERIKLHYFYGAPGMSLY